MEISLLQKLSIVSFPAIRCERRASVFIQYCGSYSHMKFAKPPTIDQPNPMTENECLGAAGGQLTLASGKKMMISRNMPLYTSYLEHGSETWAEGNVYCQGSTIQIAGELHENIMVFRSEKVLVEDVQLELSVMEGTLVDVTNRRKLSYTCRPGSACASNEDMYVFDQRPNLCSLRHIRTIQMSPLTVQGQQHYVSKAHRLYIRKGGALPMPTGCPTGTVHATQYKKLLISMDQVSTLLPVEGNVDLDLEIRTTVEFTEVEAINLAREMIQEEHHSLCLLTLQSAAVGDVRSPFTKNAILRSRGDVLTELSCSEVQVTFVLHEELQPHCYRGAVVGRVGEAVVLLDTQAFTIHELTEVSKINCEDHFPTIIKSEEGDYLSVHPKVTVERLQISTIKKFAGGPLFEHVDNGQSLLYTDSEVIKFNNLIHFGRVHKLVAARITTNLCTGKCGMKLGKSGPILDMSNLIPVGLPDFQTMLFDHLLNAGSVCGLLVFTWLAIQYLIAGGKFVKSCIQCSGCRRVHKDSTIVEIHQTAEPTRQTVELPMSTTALVEDREVGQPPLMLQYDGPPRSERRPRVTFADGC